MPPQLLCIDYSFGIIVTGEHWFCNVDIFQLTMRIVCSHYRMVIPTKVRNDVGYGY
jgi:hypothetical protein